MATLNLASIIPVEGSAKAILSNLTVNADGAPRAYAPARSGLPALDYLANAGKADNWWGIACNSKGVPLIQGPDDPAPGYYVSTTALFDPSYPKSDPRRYLDSEKIPFAVIPSTPKFGVELGDLGFAVNLANGNSSSFIVADIGPKGKFGEGSILLAKNLKVNHDPKKGGTSEKIILYFFFLESKLAPPYSAHTVLTATAKYFREIGGILKGGDLDLRLVEV
jgi:hypothetical protein